MVATMPLICRAVTWLAGTGTALLALCIVPYCGLFLARISVGVMQPAAGAPMTI
jgi:hypothetical protein